MEVKTQHICFELNPNFSIQQPESSFSTLRATYTCSIWELLEWTDAGLNLEIITTFLKQEVRGLCTEKMMENLPDSTGDGNVGDGMLHYHEVCLGKCQWSRRRAMFSAALAVSERKDSYAGLDAKIHPINADEKETGIKGKKDKEAELPAQEEACQKREQAHQDEPVLTVLSSEMIEEFGEKLKDKSVRRRILNWLNEIIHNYYKKKIAETYRREQEEGNQFYLSTFYFIRPMSRADRERQKREIWLERDNQRQSIKKYLDSYWEEKHRKKEALRIKEDERYEKCAAEHSATASACPPEEPQKRLSRWEKRCLRAKAFFFD